MYQINVLNFNIFIDFESFIFFNNIFDFWLFEKIATLLLSYRLVHLSCLYVRLGLDSFILTRSIEQIQVQHANLHFKTMDQ